MLDSPLITGGAPAADANARVLVCAVDRGLFGIQAGWVEAVYPTAATAVQATRTDSGQRQAFIVHRDEPALIVDLRQAIGLDGLLGTATRDAFVVLRSGPALLALPVDHCVGLRTLDLGGHPPVASAVRRDDGLPVGHLLELDGRMLVVLDPARILDARRRDDILSSQRRARAVCQRQHKLATLWEEIRRTPDPAALRTFASLCGRSGRARAAAGARAVLAALPGGAGDGSGLLPLLMRLAAEGRSGVLTCRCDGAPVALEIAAGRLMAVRSGGEHGRPVLAQVLAARCHEIAFTPGGVEAHRGSGDSTAAAVIAAFEARPVRRRRAGQ
ncbi:chemotaxis protein CheW [bacterium]|nr:chemotaxis protein CheW [bacterium]